MDVRTPALILLGSLLAALAFAVLGLAADNVAYVNNHHDSTVDLHYLRWNQTAEAQYSYWVQIDYLPSRFDMGRIYAMVAAGVTSGVIAISIVATSWQTRAAKSTNAKRASPLLPASLALASISFILTLAVAIYAWYPVMQWAINFRNSLPMPPSLTGAEGKTVQYQSPYQLTPDTWNCWISDFTVDPQLGDRLRSLCREAGVAKDLMIPLLIVSALLVIGIGLSWWKVSRAAASDVEEDKKEVEEGSA